MGPLVSSLSSLILRQEQSSLLLDPVTYFHLSLNTNQRRITAPKVPPLGPHPFPEDLLLQLFKCPKYFMLRSCTCVARYQGCVGVFRGVSP